MVPIARPDEEGNQVAGMDVEVLNGANLDLRAADRDTSGEALTRGPATNFQRPGHPIAALGVRMGDPGIDPHRPLDGALPAGGDLPSGEG